MNHPDGKAPGIRSSAPVQPIHEGGPHAPKGPAPTVEFQRLLEQLTELQESSRSFQATAAAPAETAAQATSPPDAAPPRAGADQPLGLPTTNASLDDEAPVPPSDGGTDRLAVDLAQAEDQFRFAMDLSKQLRDAFEQHLR